MIIKIITATIYEYFNCTTVFEIRDTKINDVQFQSLKNVKSNEGDTCINSNIKIYLMKERYLGNLGTHKYLVQHQDPASFSCWIPQDPVLTISSFCKFDALISALHAYTGHTLFCTT